MSTDSPDEVTQLDNSESQPIRGPSASSEPDGRATVSWEDGMGGDMVHSVTQIWDSIPDDDVEHVAATIRVDADFGDASASTRSATTMVDSSSVHLVERSVNQIDESTREPAEYELLSVLGTGGMGVVFQARQTSINRTVALKMQRSDSTDDGRDRKFLEEAIVTGDLDHPNIVPIHDLGRTGDGAIFYAMKEVRGTPWNDVIKKQTLDENLAVLMRTSDAIAFAHSRGVIHRDLKPENVMLGEFGEVLVLDWGLALPLNSRGTVTSLGGTPRYMAPELVTGPVTSIGPYSDVYLLGAILFEIITGTGPHRAPTSLATLLAAATNEIIDVDVRPNHDPSGELMQIARRAMRTRPEDRFASVPEFQQALRDYRSHSESIALAGRSRDVLAEAQADQDYDKFARAVFGLQNALELWPDNAAARDGLELSRGSYAEAALERGDFDLGLSVLVDSASHAELRAKLEAGRADRDSRKARVRRLKRSAVSLAVVLVLVLSIGVVWIAKAEREATQERDIAQQQEQRARRHFGLARDAVDRMLTEVADEQLAHVPHMRDVRTKLLTEALGFYQEFLDDESADSSLEQEIANAYANVAEISHKLGDHDVAKTAFKDAIRLYKQAFNTMNAVSPGEALQLKLELARCHDQFGELHRQAEQPADAEEQYNHAIELLRYLVECRTVPADQLELGHTLYNQGLLFWATNRTDEALASYNEAVQQLETVKEEDESNPDVLQGLARAHLNRGILHRGTGETENARIDYDQAIDLYSLALQSDKSRPDLRHELATAYNNLGNLLLKSSEEEERALQVLKLGESTLSKLATEFPGAVLYRNEWANSLNSLGGQHFRRKEYDLAEKLWMRSRDVTAKLLESDPNTPLYHSVHGRPLTNLGWLNYTSQKYEAARQFMTDACKHHQVAYDSNNDNRDYRAFLKNSTLGLAMTALKLGDHVAVAESTDKLHAISPNDAATSFSAATSMARCVGLAGQDESLGNLPRTTVMAAYRLRALDFLSKAIDQGFAQPKSLDDDAWMPFDGDTRFEKLKAVAIAREEP